MLKKALNYLLEVKQEAKKISSPTPKEAMLTTVIVLAVVVIFSIFFLITDSLAYKSVQMILNFGS